jgi:septal ring factor EnvC (AmiA/AmiB activator)
VARHRLRRRAAPGSAVSGFLSGWAAFTAGKGFMGSILQIAVLLAVLAALVLAFLSHKTMRIYNIVLMVLVFFATLCYAYLAARTLKTHESWMTAAKAKEAELAALEKKNDELAQGVSDKTQPAVPGVRQLRLELHRIAIDRGGVWYEVAPEKIKADTGVVTVSIDAPEPHGLAEKMVVFVFDANQYLGEFQVAKAAAKSKSVDLAPNLPLDAADLKRLSTSRAPWTMYQMMPLDDAKLIAKLSEDERQTLFRNVPKSQLSDLLTEYADPNRPLRNYQLIFHHNNQQLSLLQDDIGQINENIARTKAASAKVEEEIAYLEGEKVALQSDLKNFQREQAAIGDYAAKLQQQLGTVRNQLRAVYASTKKSAEELTALQLQAAEEINRRTEASETPRASASPLESASNLARP